MVLSRAKNIKKPAKPSGFAGFFMANGVDKRNGILQILRHLLQQCPPNHRNEGFTPSGLGRFRMRTSRAYADNAKACHHSRISASKTP